MGEAGAKFAPEVEALLKDERSYVQSAAESYLRKMGAAEAKSVSK
jgi:hypothetical protein